MQGWYLMSLINSFHRKAVCIGGLQLGRGWVSRAVVRDPSPLQFYFAGCAPGLHCCNKGDGSGRHPRVTFCSLEPLWLLVINFLYFLFPVRVLISCVPVTFWAS